MTDKRFIRNIVGHVYDTKNDEWYDEDLSELKLFEEDALVDLLNCFHEKIILLEQENEELKKYMGKCVLCGFDMYHYYLLDKKRKEGCE